MATKPMHGRILPGGSFAANRKSFRRTESGCHFLQPIYFSRSERFGTPFHLSRVAGLISERGRKDRQLTNSALNQESRSNSGQNNKCQEPLMRRPAGRDANASSNPPKVIAVADPNFSVTPKTQR